MKRSTAILLVAVITLMSAVPFVYGQPPSECNMVLGWWTVQIHSNWTATVYIGIEHQAGEGYACERFSDEEWASWKAWWYENKTRWELRFGANSVDIDALWLTQLIQYDLLEATFSTHLDNWANKVYFWPLSAIDDEHRAVCNTYEIAMWASKGIEKVGEGKYKFVFIDPWHAYNKQYWVDHIIFKVDPPLKIESAIGITDLGKEVEAHIKTDTMAEWDWEENGNIKQYEIVVSGLSDPPTTYTLSYVRFLGFKRFSGFREEQDVTELIQKRENITVAYGGRAGSKPFDELSAKIAKEGLDKFACAKRFRWDKYENGDFFGVTMMKEVYTKLGVVVNALPGIGDYVIVGGPIAAPALNAINQILGISFNIDVAGGTLSLTVGGKTYSISTAEFGKKDYAVIALHYDGTRFICGLQGITRYGTRAAALWFSNKCPYLPEKNYVVLYWEDKNDNGRVELAEVKVVAEG